MEIRQQHEQGVLEIVRKLGHGGESIENPVRNTVEQEPEKGHEKIGEGSLGIDTFAKIINHPKLRDIPFFLETPNELPGYAKEIELLKSLYQ